LQLFADRDFASHFIEEIFSEDAIALRLLSFRCDLAPDRISKATKIVGRCCRFAYVNDLDEKTKARLSCDQNGSTQSCQYVHKVGDGSVHHWYVDCGSGTPAHAPEMSRIHLRAGHMNMKRQIEIALIGTAIIQTGASLSRAGAAIRVYDRNRINKPVGASAGVR
jgi:hypothetical protein